MKHTLFSTLSRAGGRWLRALPRQLIPNLGTVLVVSAMLFAYRAWAAPGSAPAMAPADPNATPGVVSYQGYLTGAGGNPLNGNVDATFRLYSVPSGGTALWTEAHTGANAVPVSNGLFNVLLGSLNPIPSSVWSNSTVYLGVQVGSDAEMTPREVVGAVPEALIVPDGAIGTAQIADGAVTTTKLNLASGNVGIGTVNPIARLHLGGSAMGFQMGDQAASQNFHITIDDVGGSRGLRFWNGNYGSGSHIATFLANGNVGIGTFNPGVRLDVVGNFRATGTKSAVVQTSSFGQRELYAVESPEVLFSDEGLAQLENGVARVDLDPLFLETIEGEYLVHVTPYGDASLYVAEIGEDYFVVKAREGDSDVQFAWRLSAHRKGYSGVRLEQAEPDMAP